MSGFVDVMVHSTDTAITRWNGMSEKDGGSFEVDIHEEMMRLTFHIVGLTLLSQDLLGEAEVTGKALTVAMYFANQYAESLVRSALGADRENRSLSLKARATLDQMVFRIIEERRKLREAGDKSPSKQKVICSTC